MCRGSELKHRLAIEQSILLLYWQEQKELVRVSPVLLFDWLMLGGAKRLRP